MKRKIRRILAVALAFCLMISSSQISSYAEVLGDSGTQDDMEISLMSDGETDDTNAEEESTTMPAVTLSEESDGMTVTVDAPEGAFPEGVTMTVTAADTAAFLSAVEAQDFSQYAETYTVIDSVVREISFYVDDEEVQPATEVTVTFSGLALATEADGLAADYALVYHMTDDGSVEYIEDGQGQEAGLSSYSFTASDFSSYGVVNVNVEYAISTVVDESVNNAVDTIVYSYTTQGGWGQSGTTVTNNINVHFVDSSGNALSSATITAADLPTSFSGSVALSTIAGFSIKSGYSSIYISAFLS